MNRSLDIALGVDIGALVTAGMPIELVTAETMAAPIEAPWPVWVWAAVWIGGVLSIALFVGAVRWWKWSANEQDEDLAFDALARTFGVRGQGRDALVKLAKTIGAPPVALLISEHCFEQGITSYERREPAKTSRFGWSGSSGKLSDEEMRTHVGELRRCLFGDD